MKIGIDGRLWSESGVGRYVRNLVNGLESRKTHHEFTIFLTSNKYDEISFQNRKIKKVRADVRWHTFSEQWEFKKIIDREKLDLMHFPYFSYPVFYNRPFVITIHDLIIDHFPTGMASSLPLPLYYLKRFGYQQIISTAVRNSAKIIAPSYATQKELYDHYKKSDGKIEVIHEGFDPMISKKGNSALVSKKYILYVGNAYPHKNLENLISAYNILSEISDIELVCIGREDFFYKRFEKKAPKGVHFLHKVDDSTLFEYYTNATIVAMPSLMEGFGLPLLEAMSLSCPVVCSDIAVFHEIGNDAVVYFDAKSPQSISGVIQKVLSDQKLRLDMVKKGLSQSKKFSWEECVRKTLHVYESCNSV